MPDSSAIMNALIAKLGAHAPLLALMPDGVYEDEASAGMTRFVIVSQILAIDEDVFQKRAWEDALYLVEARTRDGGDVAAAAHEIEALLAPPWPAAPATLAVAGYGLMDLAREEFVRGVEGDAIDPSIRWKRRGGHYRVMVTPT
jgi:hypothetical protein